MTLSTNPETEATARILGKEPNTSLNKTRFNLEKNKAKLSPVQEN